MPGAPRQVGTPYISPTVEEGLKTLSGADAKQVTEGRENAYSSYGKDLASIQMIQDFLPQVRTGWGAETRLQGASILQSLGVDPDKIKNSFLGIDPTAGQLLNKRFLELSAGAVRAMGAREPGSVINLFKNAYPSLESTPDTITLQTNAIAMDRLRATHEADAKAQYYRDSLSQNQQDPTQYRGLNGFDKQFNATNDPQQYLHAAEAMSMRPEAWKGSSSDQQQNIYNLIPSGKHFIDGDGKERVKP